MINWTDPDCQVSEHFTVKDCLWLATWGRLATEDDGFDLSMQNTILKTVQMAEDIRAILGVPMSVTSMFRPSGYSPIVGGTAHDVHTRGEAIDFTTEPNLSIEDAKSLLRPKLEELGIRLEKGTTTWCHCDSHAVGPSGREFTA
jgi:hypothetical protein